MESIEPDETVTNRSTSGEVSRLSTCADGFDPRTVRHFRPGMDVRLKATQESAGTIRLMLINECYVDWPDGTASRHSLSEIESISSPLPRLRIGTRVRLIRAAGGAAVGDEATVVDSRGQGVVCYDVKIATGEDAGARYIVPETDLELVPMPSVKHFHL